MPAARATPSPELLIAHALFGGPRDRKVVRLLVDTGATVTILPPQVALAIGCDPAKARRRIAIITAKWPRISSAGDGPAGGSARLQRP